MKSDDELFDGRTVLAWAACAAAAGMFALGVVLLAAFFGSSRPEQIRRAVFATETECRSAPISPETTAVPSTEVPTDPDPAAQTSVYDSVLRLHILANSDSDEDQAAKLAVRDAVLELTAELLARCPDRDTAAVIIEVNEDAILRRTEEVLAARGADYGASLQIGMEQYPERDYGGEIYPAGEYLSVRILLGSGEGHNWWCVLFPRLCLAPALMTEAPTSEEKTQALPEPTTDGSVEVGLTPEQYRRATSREDVPRFRIRFRFLELLAALFDGDS